MIIKTDRQISILNIYMMKYPRTKHLFYRRPSLSFFDYNFYIAVLILRRLNK